jgi:hypothetical protein
MMPRRCRPVPEVPSSAFRGFRFLPDVIVLAVRWYLRYGLSYRDLEELLAERGVEVVGAENPSGHHEQGFRATRSDPCAMPRPSECAGAPTNEALANAANAVKRFYPRLRCQDARPTNRAHERQDHSGRSRSSGGPSHHGHRWGETAGQRSGRIFGTHRVARFDAEGEAGLFDRSSRRIATDKTNELTDLLSTPT